MIDVQSQRFGLFHLSDSRAVITFPSDSAEYVKTIYVSFRLLEDNILQFCANYPENIVQEYVTTSTPPVEASYGKV